LLITPTRHGYGLGWFSETPSSIGATEKCQEHKVGCPKEVAFNMGWISAEQVAALGAGMG